MTSSQLPSKIGPVEFAPDHTRVWNADAHKFDPIIHAEAPAPAPQSAPPSVELPTAQQTPICLIPSTNFIPKEYRLHLHSQRCQNCSTLHEWTAAYAFNELQPRAGMGKRISHLVPVDSFSYNVPVRHLRIPEQSVPACFECVDRLDLSNLQKPADTAAYKALVGTSSSSNSSSPTEKPLKEKKSPGTKTLDDILF